MGFLIGGSGAVAIGLCLSPMMAELRWSNGLTSSMATAFNLTGLLSASGIGVALDRWGPRPVMALGVLAVSSGFMLAGICHAWYIMVFAFALVGVGYFASFYLPSTIVVTSWVGAQKSLAMGLVLGAASMGAAVLSPLIGWLIALRGWRFALEAIAASSALMLPLVLFAIRMQPAREVPPTPTTDGSNTTQRSMLFTPTFIAITAASVLFNIGMGSILYHIVAVLIKAGYSAYWAGFIYGATWLLSALGSLLLGIIADRIGARVIFGAALICVALGTLFLAPASNTEIGIACVLIFVLLWGTSANCSCQFVPIVFAEQFGSHNLGMLIGAQSALAGVAGTAAPILTGLLYDKFNDYRPAIYLSAAASSLAAASVLLFKPRWDRSPLASDGV